MQIKILSLGQLKTNCYILYKDGEGIIIDPADDSVFIYEQIEKLRIKPKIIVATHGHFDHNLAAGELQALLNIPYYINERDVFLLKKIENNAQYWLKIKSKVILPTEIYHLNSATEIFFSDEKVSIIETPGHTPGSVCLKVKNFVFSGDTLFKNDIGRYDFPYSSKTDIKKSLEKLMELPKDTIVFPGHGDQTTINDEKKD